MKNGGGNSPNSPFRGMPEGQGVNTTSLKALQGCHVSAQGGAKRSPGVNNNHNGHCSMKKNPRHTIIFQQPTFISKKRVFLQTD